MGQVGRPQAAIPSLGGQTDSAQVRAPALHRLSRSDPEGHFVVYAGRTCALALLCTPKKELTDNQAMLAALGAMHADKH